MDSILHEIEKIRMGKPLSIDYCNSNRYRLVTSEKSGALTAYCFSSPIYNRKTRKLVDLCFHNTDANIYTVGSDAEIIFSDKVEMKNEFALCRVSLPGNVSAVSNKVVSCGVSEIYPSLNGIAIKATCPAGQVHTVTVKTSVPFLPVRANDKYLALMQKEHKPYMVISCIGALDKDGRLISPCALGYQKNSDWELTLKIRSEEPNCKFVFYEVNLHEPKLLHDTTVESLHPRSNNAFGTSAYLGNTSAFGEQWLYTRPDFSRLPELLDREICKATLYLPIYGGDDIVLSAFRVPRHFCSFGSHWDNRIAVGDAFAESSVANGFQRIDITNLISDKVTHSLLQTEGLILKAQKKGSGFTAVSSGDSCFSPQILEVNFRR